jgi:hypothetical protein
VSTWYAAELACGRCRRPFEVQLLRGANATRANAVREAALAGTLNRVTCPACNAPSIADAALVYSDPDRNQWISVAKLDDLTRWAEIETSVVAAFQTALETSVAATFASATRMRVVFGVDELRERLVIWNAGLDDGVVECVKLRCLRERPLLHANGSRIRVASIDQEGLSMRSAAAEAPEQAFAEWRVRRDLVDAVANEPEWRVRFPELFASGFVSIDRYLRV